MSGPTPALGIQHARNDFYRIASLNCNSFVAPLRQQRFLDTFAEKGLGVLCLQETHHTPTTNLTLPDYFTLASPPREPYKGRGVAILARTDLLRRHCLRLEFIQEVFTPTFQLLAARLGNLIVISAYVYAGLTTSVARTAHINLVRTLENLLDSHPRSSLIVGGDFNYAPLHDELFSHFAGIGLSALLGPGTPTRRQQSSSGTALDNIFSDPSLHLDPGFTRPSISDHLFVIGSLRSIQRSSPRPQGPPPPLPIAFNRLTHSPRANAITKARYESLLHAVRTSVSNIPATTSLSTYQAALTSAARSTLGTTPRRSKPLSPWMQVPSVIRAYARLNLARNYYWHRRSTRHRKSLNKARRVLKAVTRAAKRALYASFLRKLDYGRLDLFYQTRRARIRPLSAAAGGLLHTDVAINFWSEIFRRRPLDLDVASMEPLTHDLAEFLHQITPELILQAIHATAPRSSGPDGLDVRLLKATAGIIAPQLARLFPLALQEGIPPILRLGRTVLIPKSSPSDDPAQYRPISVLPVLTRLLHKVTDLIFRRYLTAHRPFSLTQAGFQAGRSPLEHAATLKSLAFLQGIFRETLFVAFLDIEKAFDTIPHARLLHVLHVTLGFPLAYVEVVRRLLTSYSTTLFDIPIPVSRGCFQGSPLSPLLCLCYLEDLVTFLTSRGPPPSLPKPFTTTADLWLLLVLLLFCDDIGLLAISLPQLHWLLDGVRAWTVISGLRLSPKSQLMALGSNPSLPSLIPLHAGLPQPLLWVDEFRYLGVTFFSSHTQNGRSPPPPPLDTHSLRYQLFLMADVLKSPSQTHLAHARIYASGIHSLVLARALYPSPIHTVDTCRLDTLINKFARRYFRLPTDTSTVFLRTELDILPSTHLIWLRRLRYLPHFLNGAYFRTFIRPFMATPDLPHTEHILHSFVWLIQALRDAGFTLPAFLAKMAEPTFTMTAWRRESKHIVYRHYARRWPHIFPSGPRPRRTLPGDPTIAHLHLVCLRRHLPSELHDLHPVTGRLPFGLPLYVRIGGLFASIGIRFKAYSLRPAFASGQPAHGRAPCTWCGRDGECGTHLLTCSRAPASAITRRDTILLRIFIEATKAPMTSRLLRSHIPTLLTYTYRLEWPNMTAPTLHFILKELARLLNEYRNDLLLTLGGQSPFSRFDIPP